MARSSTLPWLGIFTFALVSIWAHSGGEATFVAFWFGIIGWYIGRTWE